MVTEMLQESLLAKIERLSMHFIISVSPLFLSRSSARTMSEDFISLVPLVRDVDVVLLEALVSDDVHEGLFLVHQ